MKKLGRLGNVEFQYGWIIGLCLFVDIEDTRVDYHLVLPGLSLSYTHYKPKKKNRYHGEF